MTFDTIGYAPEEHLLMTFDGASLLAHDAQTEGPRWSLAFEAPIVAVLFADLEAFPALPSANPWRQSAAQRWVVAIDATGLVHVVDGTSGKEASALGPFGTPLAVAAGAGGRFALATTDRVHVWRSGERAEVPDRATALAFSNDGSTLAIGAADGTLRFLSVPAGAPPVETFCAVVHGGVNDLVQHPNGNWVVGGRQGVHVVSDAGPTRLANMPPAALRVRFDAKGERLAAQLSERSVAVYRWPSLEVQSRIEYIERPVRGLAWGPQNWLGVGLDLGDGNKIDVVTSATHRTDTHPNRQHNSWVLSVQGPAQRLSAKEAADVARMRDPFHVAPAPRNNNAGKIGFGVVVTIGLFVLRIALIAGRSSSSYHPSYTPPPNLDYGSLGLGTTGANGTCDMSCAKLRVNILQIRCASDLLCKSHASNAYSALLRSDCAGAKAALNRITTFGGSTAYGGSVSDSESLSSARRGIDQACQSSVPAAKKLSLVTLGGTDLEVTTESLPAGGSRTTPGALWTAPDGTLFATSGSGSTGYVDRRDPASGLWRNLTVRNTHRPVEVWGKNARSVVIMDQDSLAYWDGASKTEIAPPATGVYGLGGVGDDVLVIGDGNTPQHVAATRDDDDDDSQVFATRVLYRRRLLGGGNEWKVEPVAPKAVLGSIWSGGSTALVTATVKTADHGDEVRLYQRSAGGQWTERRWWGAGAHPIDDSVSAAWIGAKNEIFLATERGVMRSTNGGASFTRTDNDNDDVYAATDLWGRSATDVFAATPSGLQHWDGKAWTHTSHSRRARSVSGTATSVYVLDEVDDD